ncbi:MULTISPECIES: cytochrome P450 [Streptomyces]|uniref:Cytochrome P450 n=1 Tax=Streptomyces evansiae TaxID=3075535 RepID=A0ABU2RA01_9ACTN|nr:MULTISPECIES: cytochrome P450 [unclassified Streptomyces]EDY43171.1 cytochrome P450-SU2 [Streptomyces sp. SPB074]EFK98005.1 cytochrome P450 [Streptomyces sp. SPB78]MDT0413511.1 cytochrome P450 [Streptomyces sp. DSM 41979]MYQ61481.1 cytochrome P450 [Streptomyces sp. SID4926]SCE60353.1 Cytochrome P450 [Streptomyces sp. DfronAA-171]
MTVSFEPAPAFPLKRGCPFSPPEDATAFRESGRPHRVTIWDGSTPWLITRHDHIQQLLGAVGMISADVTDPGFPNTSDAQPAVEGNIFFRKDGTEHLPVRRILNPDFTAKRSEALRPRIAELTDRLLDDLLAMDGPVDLFEHFALALPTVVICEVLGVPYEDSTTVHESSKKMVQLAIAQDEKVAAHRALHELLARHMEAKRSRPDNGLLSRLVNTHVDDKGDLTFEEAVGLGVLVIGAGHETTANMIALGILALLREPSQRDLLLSDPVAYSSTAVEEMMRYWSMVQTEPRRVLTEDIEVGGVLLKAGEGIICNLPAANRDPLVFADPERLDITRRERKHIGFGYGVHQCLGQNLSRVEMQVAWPKLFERIPGLRLAVDESELHFHDDALTYGVETLPVTW